MTICSVCGHEFPSDAPFCGDCGAPLGNTDDRAHLVGRRIADRYLVKSVVAEGGMGVVYRAEQTLGSTVRSVAIKVLLPELARDPVVVSRFQRECGVIAQLEHPNTVRVYDFGRTPDGILFIAMEFVNGRALADVMNGAPLPTSRVLNVLRQVCSALDEAHEQGVVHRDLKPENIVLIERTGHHDFVKILDFGIAARARQGTEPETKLTQQGIVLGTPPYMSPEQFTGEPLDRTSDVYSLGIIAWEMLTGKLPFEAESPWQWAHLHMTEEPGAPAVPLAPSILTALKRALSKDRTKRPATATQFWDLLAAQPSEPVSVAIASTQPPGPLVVEPSAAASARGVNTTQPDLKVAGSPGWPRGTVLDDAPRVSLDGQAASAVPVRAVAQSTQLGQPRIAANVPVVPPVRRSGGARSVLIALLVLGLLAAAGGIVWALSGTYPFRSPEPVSSVLATAPEAPVTEVTPVAPPIPLPTVSSSAIPLPPQPRPTPVGPASTVVVQPSATVPTLGPVPLGLPTVSGIPSNWSVLPPLQVPFPTLPTPATVSAPPASQPPPQSVPPAATTAPNPPVDTRASCQQAEQLASSNLSAAVAAYQTCASGGNANEARRARITIADAAQRQTRNLVGRGQCAQAQQVIATVTPIGAHQPALAEYNKSNCR